MEDIKVNEFSGNENHDNNSQEEKKFTQEELNNIISKRLAKDRSKMEEEFKGRLQEEIELAKMSEKERQEALFRREKKQYEEEKAAFEKERMLIFTQRELVKNDMPESMAKFLIGSTAEETQENINEFMKINFDEIVQKRVSGRLRESEYVPPVQDDIGFSGTSRYEEDAFLKAFRK